MKAPARREGTTPLTRAALPVALALLLLSAPLPSHGLTIHLKLSGSFGLPALDEFNLSLSGWRDALRRQAEETPGWSYVGGRDGRVRGAFGIEGEVLLGFSPRWAIGVGSGFAFSEAAESATALDIQRPSGLYSYVRPTTVTATPLFVSAYHFFPLGGGLSLYVGGGAGRIRARYSASEGLKKASAANYGYSNAQSASGTGNLVQGVAGFRYTHVASLGLFLEAVWRKAQVDALTSETGTLYAYEEYRTDLDLWQVRMSVSEGPPEGETFRAVRKAVADSSGPVLKLGFFIKF